MSFIRKKKQKIANIIAKISSFDLVILLYHILIYY